MWCSSPSRPLLPQLLDLLPRARVEDVVLRQPRTARLAHAELDEVEGADLVTVGVDHELQPGLARGARVHVGQGEPGGLRGDLQERPGLEPLPDAALYVAGRRRPPADLAVRDVADAVD